jgi:hypothetical protein
MPRLATLSVALVGAAALALAPGLLAGRPARSPFQRLGAAEPTLASHGGGHADTRANARRDRQRARRCAALARRGQYPRACPAPPVRRAAELAPASQIGRWAAPFPIRTWAIHAILLPTGKVLWLSKSGEDGGGEAVLWDPATGTTRHVDPPDVRYPDGRVLPANVFCAGQAMLPDGRVLVAGGNLAFYESDEPGKGWKGSRWLFTFDPWNETWTRQSADMAHGRWYPTVTALPDGRALIVGGWDETGDQTENDDVELFTPSPSIDGAGGTVTTVAQRPYAQLYPHMFVLPSTTAAGAGGTKVLMYGPAGRYPANAAILDTRTWSWTPVPYLPTSRVFGAAVLMPGGAAGSRQVLLTGGADTPNDPSPMASTAVLDLDDVGAGVRPGPTMANGRNHMNAVLLPDGSLLAVGGGRGADDPGGPGIYADPVYPSELLPPGGTWRPADVQRDARTYHSTALLLPDGRVISAGDDRSTHASLDSRTAEIYSPPYLFRGARPVIASAPASVRYDAVLPVGTADAGSVARAVLMRPSAVTHATDMDQRSIDLVMSPATGGLNLRTPRDASLAPPGWYMLFLVDRDGVPSVARWVRLDPAAPDAAALPDPADDPAPAPIVPVEPPVAGPSAASAAPRPPRLGLTTTFVRRRHRVVALRVSLRSDRAARAVVRLLGAGPPAKVRRLSLSAGQPRRVSFPLIAARVRHGARLRVQVRATAADGAVATAARALARR